jgi:hypothetical protein
VHQRQSWTDDPSAEGNVEQFKKSTVAVAEAGTEERCRSSRRRLNGLMKANGTSEEKYYHKMEIEEKEQARKKKVTERQGVGGKRMKKSTLLGGNKWAAMRRRIKELNWSSKVPRSANAVE